MIFFNFIFFFGFFQSIRLDNFYFILLKLELSKELNYEFSSLKYYIKFNNNTERFSMFFFYPSYSDSVKT